MEQDPTSFTTLQDIIARLRAPDGCPWDREQTHDSIKAFLIEEAYEVLQTLDEGNTRRLCEELGDLLMQIVLHTQIAKEAKEFEMSDVLQGIITKLIRRHPHVFGDKKVASADEVAANWQALKQTERDTDASLLATIPKQMPALAYSRAIQQRAATAGFEWQGFDNILEKLVEELEELKQTETHQRRVQEFGDLLFALADTARWLGVDPEEALRLANQRFYHRFSYMEEVCRRRGVALGDLSFAEQDMLWQEAKNSVSP